MRGDIGAHMLEIGILSTQHGWQISSTALEKLKLARQPNAMKSMRQRSDAEELATTTQTLADRRSVAGRLASSAILVFVLLSGWWLVVLWIGAVRMCVHPRRSHS
ncbi:hypothetical protein DL89DRAFT_264243 [Linderina pennispora]|uniref:Uncharacterized protein n=1 Tax=Linderina pennispora TaxID=61395 RepID=A0A1Y1WMI7_9FUNG|nr:uncharacterized protein DL89DRAFT_264243 [Linderina pennispora]ORX74334.1 hypothetical protein DL89DRAFT_264243 [Linderina pennispora]